MDNKQEFIKGKDGQWYPVEHQDQAVKIHSAEECRYCKTHFVPTRRFAQKYCCESCRVLAYRQRKSIGLSGVRSDRKQPTISDLQKEIKSLRRVVTNNQHIQIGLEIGVLIAQVSSLVIGSKEHTETIEALQSIISTLPDKETEKVKELLKGQGFVF